ncbi:MAG: hypothetical protein HYT48_00785 [Candidatus Vogelbacteria bacterium]|nr:hypothetical protein [Candidatus Vogelbacteria bacterium]
MTYFKRFSGVLILALFLALTPVLATATLFSDGFESDDFSNWSISDPITTKWVTVNNADGAHGGNIRAKVTGNTTLDFLSRSQSTSGFENISLSYYYKVNDGLESDDHLLTQWSTDGSIWNTLQDLTTSATTTWTFATHSLPAEASNQSSFRFRFIASFNSASTDVVSIDDVELTGTNLPASLEIITQPQDQTANSGASATFSISATGTEPLSYQWQTDHEQDPSGLTSHPVPFYDIPGATDNTYQTPPVNYFDHGTKFRVIVSNASDEVTSNEAALSTYTLFSGIAAGGWGTITRDPVLTDRASYADGTVITLNATPKGDCNQFDHWIIGPGVSDISTTTNPLSVTISATGPRAVAAHFAGDCYIHDDEDGPPPPPPPSPPSGGGSSGGSRSGGRISPLPTGQVLGAFTSNVNLNSLTSEQRAALIQELRAKLIALLQQLRDLLLAQLASLGR